MRAVGGTAGYGAVISAMPVIDSISGMPISIGGVGVREKLFEVLMRDLAGVPPSIAVAASLAGFACNVVWAALGALFFPEKARPRQPGRAGGKPAGILMPLTEFRGSRSGFRIEGGCS